MSVSETNRVNDQWQIERDMQGSVCVEELSREFPLKTEENHKNFKILVKISARQLRSMSLEYQYHSNLIYYSVLLTCIPSFDRDHYIWNINYYKNHRCKHRNNWTIYFETGASHIFLHFNLLKKC